MKVYVYVSAAHFNDECTNLIDVQVSTSKITAVSHFEKTVKTLTSEEGGWSVLFAQPNHIQLTDGDNEYVACVVEREI